MMHWSRFMIHELINFFNWFFKFFVLRVRVHGIGHINLWLIHQNDMNLFAWEAQKDEDLLKWLFRVFLVAGSILQCLIPLQICSWCCFIMMCLSEPCSLSLSSSLLSSSLSLPLPLSLSLAHQIAVVVRGGSKRLARRKLNAVTTTSSFAHQSRTQSMASSAGACATRNMSRRKRKLGSAAGKLITSSSSSSSRR